MSGERAQLVSGSGSNGSTYGKNSRSGDVEAGYEEMETVTYGDFVKAMLFGALDGVLTSFAICAGAAGGGLGGDVVLILGFSNILADALSMGVGEYLSSKAHNEYVEQARRREEWQMANNRETGVNDMVELYCERGMAIADAQAMVGALSKYDKFFVDVMLSEELGLPNYKPLDEGESMKEGGLMFISFAVFGSIPLLPYCFAASMRAGASAQQVFLYTCILTGLCLFIAGACKSHFSARGWLLSGLETLILGGACAGLAFEIGATVAEVIAH